MRTLSFLTSSVTMLTLVAGCGTDDAIEGDETATSESSLSATTTVNASADTWVDEAFASATHGADAALSVDFGTRASRAAYLRFTVPALPGPVSKVQLRVKFTGDSVNGPAVYRVASTSWSESGTSWTSRPAIGAKLADAGAIVPGSYTYDITGALTAGGTYAFALTTEATDGVSLASRESGSPAQLLITTTTAATSTKPGPENTGAPNIAFKRHDGNLTVTTNGTIINGMDVYGDIVVRASNVTIKNSIVRGDTAHTGGEGLISQLDDGDIGLIVEDTTIVPRSPDPLQDGAKVKSATFRRVDISGTVDGVGVYGNNVRIESSWIHDLKNQKTTTQPDGVTHNDGVQVHSGYGLRIIGSTISGVGPGAALMLTSGASVAGDVRVDRSWLGGGGCTINIYEKSGKAYQGVAITNNVFARGTTGVKDCAVVANAPTKAIWTFSNNKFDDGTSVVPK